MLSDNTRCSSVSFLILRYLSRRKPESYVSVHELCPVAQQCLQDCLQTWSRSCDEPTTYSSNGPAVSLPVEYMLIFPSAMLLTCDTSKITLENDRMWVQLPLLIPYYTKYLLLTCKVLGEVGAIYTSMQQSIRKQLKKQLLK